MSWLAESIAMHRCGRVALICRQITPHIQSFRDNYPAEAMSQAKWDAPNPSRRITSRQTGAIVAFVELQMYAVLG